MYLYVATCFDLSASEPIHVQDEIYRSSMGDSYVTKSILL